MVFAFLAGYTLYVLNDETMGGEYPLVAHDVEYGFYLLSMTQNVVEFFLNGFLVKLCRVS